MSPFWRLLFAAIGLAAGNAAPLLFVICNALLLSAHTGQPDLELAQALEIFLIYAIFSVVGWILVGVPIALAISARHLSRVTWLGRMLIGATLGPLALLLIFVILFAIQGSHGAFSLAHTEGLWLYSILVSTVSFLVYTALLRRRY